VKILIIKLLESEKYKFLKTAKAPEKKVERKKIFKN
jgi:hypothetical protein